MVTEAKATRPMFKVPGYVPVAMYTDRLTRFTYVRFENDREEVVSADQCWAWASSIERWAKGMAW